MWAKSRFVIICAVLAMAAGLLAEAQAQQAGEGARNRAGQGNTAGGSPATGRSPASPLIGRARQLITQDQDYPAALKTLDAAAQADPNNPFVDAWRGIVANRQGRYAEALPLFEKVLARDPKNLLALNGRGFAFFMSGDNGKAMADFNAAIAIDAKAPVGYMSRGIVRASMGDLQLALDDLKLAIQLGPDLQQAYANLGFVYNRMRQFDNAVPVLDQAIRLAPKYAAAYNARGFANQNLGNGDAAIADYKQAIAISPKYVKPHGNLGRIYLEKRDTDRATAEFSEVIAIDPKSVPALLGRAKAFEVTGQLDKALADIEAVLAIAPQHSVAQAALDRIKTKIAIASNGPASGAARSGGRVALVIGNSKYRLVDALANPARDAKLIADSLSRSGFTTVRTLVDGNRAQITAMLKTFAADAASADWAVIYYAGHGIEYDGNNFLVPVDVKYAADDDIPKESIALDAILNAVGPAAKLRLVILDACRDNPFAEKLKGEAEASAIGKGLARIEPDGGTLVAFATKHGHVATDGTGQDSPFATALAKRIAMPGLEINKLFRLVHDDVYASTNKEQEPFTYGQLSAQDFYFRVP